MRIVQPGNSVLFLSKHVLTSAASTAKLSCKRAAHQLCRSGDTRDAVLSALQAGTARSKDGALALAAWLRDSTWDRLKLMSCSQAVYAYDLSLDSQMEPASQDLLHGQTAPARKRFWDRLRHYWRGRTAPLSWVRLPGAEDSHD